MENHPLLRELLEICSIHDLNKSKAYTTFEAYLELLEVKKLFNLNHHFNKTLNIFYLSGKKEESNDTSDIYIPMMLQDSLSPEEIDSIQEHLCQNERQLSKQTLHASQYLCSPDHSQDTCQCLSDEISTNSSQSFCDYKRFEKFYLLIRDNDSSSTCYCITKGLVKPDSPSVHQSKKEIEAEKHKLDRIIQNNKKILYTKALKNLKSDS